MNFLTKSKYIQGQQCLRLLWFSTNKLLPEKTIAEKQKLEQWQEFDEYAHKLFLDAVNLAELEFDDFMKQLKIKLNMETRSELLDFFEKNKKELQNLKDQIEKTDNEINQMVYKLYGLSKDEVQIIEESLT